LCPNNESVGLVAFIANLLSIKVMVVLPHLQLLVVVNSSIALNVLPFKAKQFIYSNGYLNNSLLPYSDDIQRISISFRFPCKT
jgi:hypothetical protein